MHSLGNGGSTAQRMQVMMMVVVVVVMVAAAVVVVLVVLWFSCIDFDSETSRLWAGTRDGTLAGNRTSIAQRAAIM
jgi:hypothetical protein